jgi:urate oxidase
VVQLGFNRYGKAEVRVVRVSRGTGPGGSDELRDWNVSSSLSGDLSATHLTGDNSHVLATDTQKNTHYAFAKTLGGVEPEVYALALAEHFVTSQPPITRARLAVEEYPWTRIGTAGHSFVRSGQHTRTVTVLHDDSAGVGVVGGVKDLVVLNTANSEFFGFPRDDYTTLGETHDRMLATQVSAQWRFRPVGEPSSIDFATVFSRATAALLSAFAETYSYSLQQSLFAIGQRILGELPELCEVRLALPNKHHFLVDLSALGPEPLTNDNEVYYAADRPYGLIEGHVLADDAPAAGLAWT